MTRTDDLAGLGAMARWAPAVRRPREALAGPDGSVMARAVHSIPGGHP